MELVVAIYMSKAEQTFRMEWEHDIPIFKGIDLNYQWKDLAWKKMEKRVYKLQKRIYKASSRGDVKAVRKLQKTLMRSWSAKCLALQSLVKLALEPEWEARFEPNSYGFRPGRSAHTLMLVKSPINTGTRLARIIGVSALMKELN